MKEHKKDHVCIILSAEDPLYEKGYRQSLYLVYDRNKKIIQKFIKTYPINENRGCFSFYVDVKMI